MKKSIVLGLILSVVMRSFAQDSLYSEPIGWRGKDIELHTLADKDKQRNCLLLCKDDSMRLFVLDNKQAVIQHFFINRLPNEQFLGGFMNADTVYAYFQGGGRTEDLHVWVLNIREGIGDDYTVPFAMRHEKTVEQISCGDHFLYFTVNKKASQFSIYDFHAGRRCDTLQYTFEPGMWKALTAYNGGFGRDVSVQEIEPDGKINPDLAHTPNKLYWLRDTLFLLMNNYQHGVTAVYSFDIHNKKVDFRKVVHNNFTTLDHPLEEYADNSMLLDDRLYFVSAETNKLNVQIRDFYSGKLLKEYTAGRDEPIAFKNTPIVQEGSFYHPGARELKKTRQLINKMVSGSAVLIANREDSGRVGLTIGAWQQMSSGGGGGGMWMGGAGPGMTMTYVPSYNYFREMSIRSSRFKMLIDSATLEHVPGEIATDLSYRIEQYTENVSIPPAGEALFRNAGKNVYAFYDRDDHKLKLAAF